jgi:hypothetical protein
MVVVITFTSNMHFGLVHISKRGLVGKTTLDTVWEAPSTLIIINGTNCGRLTITRMKLHNLCGSSGTTVIIKSRRPQSLNLCEELSQKTKQDKVQKPSNSEE